MVTLVLFMVTMFHNEKKSASVTFNLLKIAHSANWVMKIIFCLMNGDRETCKQFFSLFNNLPKKWLLFIWIKLWNYRQTWTFVSCSNYLITTVYTYVLWMLNHGLCCNNWRSIFNNNKQFQFIVYFNFNFGTCANATTSFSYRCTVEEATKLNKNKHT